MSKTSITSAVLLLAAFIFSGYMYVENYDLKTDLEICREGEKYLIGQRDFLLDLIPELEPQVDTLSKQRWTGGTQTIHGIILFSSWSMT